MTEQKRSMQIFSKVKGKFMLLLKINLVLVVIGLVGFFAFRFFTTKSALKIESTPESFVYINGEQVGKTPLEIERSESEVEVKLVPEVFSDQNVSYTTNVELTRGVKTILQYKFGSNDSDSELLLVSFRRIGFGKPAVAVVSIPDGARVRIDSDPKGVTPIRVENLSQNNSHTVTVDAQGYKSMNFDILPQPGYILTAFVDMAANNEQVLSILDKKNEINAKLEEVDEEVEDIPYVIISNTPTGYLRVREEALLSSPIVDEVLPGEKYDLISDTDPDWYEISLSASVSGFISSEYATASAKVKN